MSILDRYMVREFLAYFLAVIVGFVVLMTGNTAYIMSDLISGKQIPFWSISQILILRMPAMIVLGLPVATIFAVFLAMGRLGKDSELIAMRTGGVSFQRIILPVLGMAALVSLGSFWLNEEVVPTANHVSQNTIRQFWLTEVMEQAESQVFFKIPGDLVIYTGAYDHETKSLKDVFVFDTKSESYPTVTLAKTGKMDEHTLKLKDGGSFEFKGTGDIERNTNFREYNTDISREIHELFGEQRTAQEMTSYQLKDMIEDYDKMGTKNVLASQKTDYYFKFSIPVANLAFALVGLLFVVSTPRKDNYSGILIGLVLIMVYWVLMTISRSMGQQGLIDSRLAAWSQNLVYFVVGLPILFLARR
ncbi:MAG: LptF/LptG family permease [bacterium]